MVARLGASPESVHRLRRTLSRSTCGLRQHRTEVYAVKAFKMGVNITRK
jgi:hypothetical protein